MREGEFEVWNMRERSAEEVAGRVAGTWAQQRISSRALTILFAAFLVAIAVRLLLE